MKRLATSVLIVGGMLAASVSGAVAATYSLTELLPVPGWSVGFEPSVSGINSSGDVVAKSAPADYSGTRGTRWDGTTGAPTNLEPLAGGTGTEAWGINDSGDVVGFTGGGGLGNIATKWDGTTYAPTTLAPIEGGTNSLAANINNSGDAVGESWGGNIDGNIPTKWDGATNTPTALILPEGGTNGFAIDINDSGDVLGLSYGGTIDNTITLWDGATNSPTALSPLAGAAYGSAWAINDSGDVVGVSEDSTGLATATLWDGTTHTPTALNQLEGATYSEARAINNSGHIVGSSEFDDRTISRAIIWIAGIPIDLNSLLDVSGSGWVLLSAWGINDAGQILAYGEYGVGDDAYKTYVVLTSNVPPVPLPAGVWLLLSALGGLGFAGWRKKRVAA